MQHNRENAETIQVRPLDEGDRIWTTEFLTRQWGSARIVSRCRVHEADTLPGFVVQQGGEPIGLLTYNIEGDECEIVTINCLIEGVGFGTELLKAVIQTAVDQKCKRVWAVTTNDNLNALRFFQTRGFVLAGLYRNAMARARELKPEIPARGFDDIAIRDEIEVEMPLL